MDGEELDILLLKASKKALINVVYGYIQQHGIEVWQINELKFNDGSPSPSQQGASKKEGRQFFHEKQYNGEALKYDS